MAHTFTSLIYHIVFSTQGRISLIKPDQRSELFAYLGGLVREQGGTAMIVNGVSDHVHMLIVLRPDVSLSDVMKFVKANSSRWMKRRYGKTFAWQKGYGAFSVSRSGVDAVVEYIRKQEMHHKKMDFEREFVLLLAKNEVEYDPEFLWR